MKEKTSLHSIRVDGVSVRYDEPVLVGINLSIRPSKITAIVGPNGAGKTTLLKSMIGLVQPYEGTVTFFGERFEDAVKKISYVPQHSTVNWDFPITVLDVVLMGRYRKVGMFGKVGNEHRNMAMRALKSMEMEGFASRQISQLSGGQKQRVFIARSLCQEAEILLMDEPLAGVDKRSEQIIMDILKSLKEQGKTVVCVHHELSTIKKYFDDVVFINKTLVAAGSVEDVFHKGNIDRTYYEVAVEAGNTGMMDDVTATTRDINMTFSESVKFSSKESTDSIGREADTTFSNGEGMTGNAVDKSSPKEAASRRGKVDSIPTAVEEQSEAS